MPRKLSMLNICVNVHIQIKMECTSSIHIGCLLQCKDTLVSKKDMKKKELIQLINQLLEPIGFKRKGNFWVINGDEITKIVNLQKSQYNDSFYINYGYIINSIPLDGMMMHVYNRLHSIDNKENESIAFLLNLNNEILDQDRIFQLTNIIEKNMITELVKTNTEKDILSNLKNRPHLNDIPLVVKRYLKISLE
jgi:hypothetical protein